MKNFLKSNGVFVIFAIAYIIFFYACFYQKPIIFVVMMLILGVSVAAALSPLGESILRFVLDAREIEIEKDRNKILPVFHDVYNNVLEHNPTLSRYIKLYIEESPTINACAFGSNSIMVTRGAIETLSQNELYGLFAHEFGHLSNGDTKMLLLMTIGGGVFSLIFFVLNIGLKILDFLLDTLKSVPGFLFCAWILKFGKWLMVTFINLIIKVIELILQASKRNTEYCADKFASDIGYGNELKDVLYILKEMNINEKMSFIEKLTSSHPNLANRIRRLENLRI